MTDNAIQSWLRTVGGKDADQSQCNNKTVAWSHDFEQQRPQLYKGEFLKPQLLLSGRVISNQRKMWSDRRQLTVFASSFSLLCPAVWAGCGETGTANVTFVGDDQCGNKVSIVASVTITDNVAPTLTAVAASVAADCAAVPQAPSVTAVDACDKNVQVVRGEQRVNGSCESRYQLLRSWNATDACGNTASIGQEVQVTDNNGPVLAGQANNVSAECVRAEIDQRWRALVNSQAGVTAQDSCTAVTWSSTTLSDVQGCGGTVNRLVQFTASDACGQTASFVASFEMYDSRPPSSQTAVPSVVDMECAELQPLANLTLSDSCDASPTQLASETRFDGPCPQSYTLTRRWVLMDACGNNATVVQTVRVRDETAPEVLKPAVDLPLECDPSSNSQAIEQWLSNHGWAEAEDSCSGNSSQLQWSHNYDSVKAGLTSQCGGRTGSARVTFTVQDGCGNKATTSATVSVSDSRPPEIVTQPQGQTAECTGSSDEEKYQLFLAQQGSAVAVDKCSGTAVRWTYNATATPTCGQTAVRQVVFAVTDMCSNLSSTAEAVSFTTTDHGQPRLTLAGPNPQVVEAYFAWEDAGVAGIEDACHTIAASSVVVQDQPDTGAVGRYNVSYVVTDACNQTGVVVRQVVVQDRLAPRVEVSGRRWLLLRQGFNYFDAGAAVADYPNDATAGVNSSVYVHKAGVVDAGVELGDAVAAGLVTRQVGEQYVVYFAEDRAGNTETKLGRTLEVLGAVEFGDVEASWDVTVDAGQAFSLGQAPSWAAGGSSSGSESGLAGGGVGVAVVFVLSNGQVTRPQVRNMLLQANFSSDVNFGCFAGSTATQCVATAEFATELQRALLRSQPGVLAVARHTQTVVSYAGAVVAGDGDVDPQEVRVERLVRLAENSLSRSGVDEVDIGSCVAVTCLYENATRPVPNSFSAPVTPAMGSVWARLRSQTAASKGFAYESLLRAGIVPSYFEWSGQEGVAVLRGLWPGEQLARVGMAATETVVSAGYRFNVTVKSGVAETELRMALLSAGVVASSVEWLEGGDGRGGLACVSTFSELVGLEWLGSTGGQPAVVTAMSSVEPMTPVMLPSAAAAARGVVEYEVMLASGSGDDDGSAGVAAVQAVLSQLVGVRTSNVQAEGATMVRFEASRGLSKAELQQVEGAAGVSSVVKLPSLLEEVAGAARVAVERLLPVDSQRIRVRAVMWPSSNSNSSEAGGRGRRDIADVSGLTQEGVLVSVTVAPPAAQELGAARYEFSFGLVASVDGSVAYSKAQRVVADAKAGRRGEGRGGREQRDDVDGVVFLHWEPVVTTCFFFNRPAFCSYTTFRFLPCR